MAHPGNGNRNGNLDRNARNNGDAAGEENMVQPIGQDGSKNTKGRRQNGTPRQSGSITTSTAQQSLSVSSSGESQSSSVLTIPPTAAAGGISMTQPPMTVTTFYRIASNEVITFGWVMTSVLASPTHLTVSAVADNGNTYPVGPTNGIIPGDATQVVWDIGSYQQNNPTLPLAQGTYTLNIWDERGPGALRAGGYLSPFNGLRFAMFTPQPSEPLASNGTCLQCGAAAISAVTHPVFVGVVVSFLVICLSGLHMLRMGH